MSVNTLWIVTVSTLRQLRDRHGVMGYVLRWTSVLIVVCTVYFVYRTPRELAAGTKLHLIRPTPWLHHARVPLRFALLPHLKAKKVDPHDSLGPSPCTRRAGGSAIELREFRR